ncbi:hypothetical protein CYY_002171 [Polysphondylium violaceum]|uniref:Uncharacterized protein n=1 Tax=Polysphondylium violaceum TaxID=133409 RepID=A0A8J4Q200_9MYCE|nr:hypothetical protein CYY_002171 [Polysphondylium violaceum]
MKFISIALLLTLSVCFSFAALCSLNNGYSSQYSVNSYNTYFPTESGYEASTFFESGMVTVDYDNQMMNVISEVLSNGKKIVSQIYAFNGNKTLYVISGTSSGGMVCNTFPLKYPVPTSAPKVLNDLGGDYIGDIPVELLQVQSNNGPNVVERTLFDFFTCSPTVSFITNTVKANPGIATMVFTNYGNYSIPIELDSSCYNAKPGDESMVHLPKAILSHPYK